MKPIGFLGKPVIRLVVVIIVLIAGSLTGAAQGTATCLALAPEDCAIVQSSNAQFAALRSLTHDSRFSLTITGLNALKDEKYFDRDVSAQGSGPFMVEPGGFTADSPFGGYRLAMEGATLRAEDRSRTVNLVLAEGRLYVQNPVTQVWIGAALADLIADKEVNLPAPAANLILAGIDAVNMMFDPALLEKALGSRLAALVPMKLERLPEEQIGGLKVYPFRLTADFGALFASPEFKALVRAAVAASIPEDPSADQWAEYVVESYLAQVTGTITFTRWIGAEDMLPRRVALDIQATFDAGAATTGTDLKLPPGALTLSFTTELSDFNGAQSVTIPEGGVSLVPLEAFVRAFESW